MKERFDVKGSALATADSRGSRSSPTFCSPALYETVNKAVDEVLAETRKMIPVYSYPDYVATAAMLNKYTITKAESAPIDALDAQKEAGKAIFGKGLLLAERAAAERAAATRWEISPRERELIQSLG